MPVPESQKKKAATAAANAAAAAKAKAEGRAARRASRSTAFHNAAKYAAEYKSAAKQEARLGRQARENGDFYVPETARLLCVIRCAASPPPPRSLVLGAKSFPLPSPPGAGR